MKHLPVIITTLLILGLTGCAGSSSAKASETAAASETQTVTEETSDLSDEEDEETSETKLNEDIPEADLDFTLDNYAEPAYGNITNEGPLYQDDMITITAENFETDSLTTYLFLSIENTTDQDLSVNCTLTTLNDFVLSSGLYEDLPANTKTETALEFDNAMINACGIHTITKAELTFAFFDLESAALLSETDALTVTTDADPANAQSDIINGDLLYSRDNVQIIFKGIFEDDDGMAMIALLFVNQSDKDIAFDLEEDGFVIDGQSHLSAFSLDLPSGRNSLSIISSYDPEEGIIDFTQTAELTFSLSDMETWDVIDVPDTIVISREVIQ